MRGDVKEWTPADDEQLTEWWENRMSSMDIAIRMGRSRYAIQRRAWDLGIKRKPKELIPIKARKKAYIDCMPNPFKSIALRKRGFDYNFYRR